MEIFSFKINGLDPFKILYEQLKNPEFSVEVYMNPLYFSAEVAMGQLMPGFRKKQLTEKDIEKKLSKCSKAWAFQFERNIKEYVDLSRCKKIIVED
jgi:hypothetical protein